ncbi:hypothetical protein AZE42_01381 [Rhizopogon vesiculosus]|uniref:laccase n=1 Tax=Rhizopogon vesiculosus TaxID=180088 RepID=A0A1J8QHP1_9AGAM|nr:hypothetical protein AZE42_01381 [Rhizopogon vesiculosus]
MGGLHESLQAEFCPPLDASLLAAIIADHAGDDDDITPTPEQVEDIRQTLMILANHAQMHYEHDLEEMEAVEASLYSFSNMSTTSPTTPELYDSITMTSSGSDTSSSQHSFSSPLGFLQEAFSDVPTERLKRLLRTANGEALDGEGDVDMERVVEYILTMEHIRDLEERGLDAIEPTPLQPPTEGWETVVRTKPKPIPKLAMPAKKKAKGRTIKLVDVRQTQHALPSPAKTKVTVDAGVDTWTHISSLSTHLATLLPPAPASHFTSFFHSPTHATPACALRAALAALPSTSNKNHQTKSDSPIKRSNQVAETNTLSALLDLLQASPTFATLDGEQRDTLYADARLALTASRNKPDEALDVVWILRDLEHPESNAGIYHLPPPLPSSTARAKMPAGAPVADPITANTPARHPLVETDLHALINPGAPGIPGYGNADINLNLVVSSDSSKYYVNGVSFQPPTVPVLLQILSGAQQPSQLLPNGSVIILEANKVVELTMSSTGPGGPHPMHLHGHTFDVVQSAGNSTFNYVNPVRRDVVSAGGDSQQMVIRWVTDNAGPWFLHCHIDWHLDIGLAVVMAESPSDTLTYNPIQAEWDELCPIYDSLSLSQLGGGGL